VTGNIKPLLNAPELLPKQQLRLRKEAPVQRTVAGAAKLLTRRFGFVLLQPLVKSRTLSFKMNPNSKIPAEISKSNEWCTTLYITDTGEILRLGRLRFAPTQRFVTRLSL